MKNIDNQADNNGQVNAYSLIRFSTDRQHFGTSKKRQEERCQDECQRRGWTFDAKLNLMDLGVSAFRGNNFNPKFALGKFIDASKKGLLLPNPVLIVENADRFSRAKMSEAKGELWGLVRRGVKVLILSNGLLLVEGDDDDPVKDSILNFEFSRANQESERKSELVNAGMAKKYAAMCEGKAVQLGHIQPKWIDFLGEDKQIGAFKLNDKAQLIKDIVNAYMSGDSFYRIALDLNKRKVKCLRHSKRWTRASVSQLLYSDFLIGNITMKGKQYKGYYPAVLTDTEWRDLQNKLNDNGTKKGNVAGTFIANLFRNRCKCSKCEGNVGVGYSRGKRYYFCSNTAYGKGECDIKAKIWTRDIEEDFFGDFMAEYPSLLAMPKDNANDKAINETKAQIATLEKQLADGEALQKQLKGVSIESIAKHYITLDNQLTQAKDNLLKLTRQGINATNAPIALSKVKGLLKSEDLMEYDKGARVLMDELADNEIRKQLLEVIPSLAKELVIDLVAGTYQIKLPNDSITKARQAVW